MKAVGNRFIIRIDKVAQTDRRNFRVYKNPQTGELLKLALHPNNVHMTRNLQYGEIVSIGEPAKINFPEAAEGDILIFHHSVEHKPNPGGDRNYYVPSLLGIEEDGNELYSVSCDYQTFGVLKLSMKTIIPFKGKIFCHTQYIDAAMLYKPAASILDPNYASATQSISVIKQYEVQSDMLMEKLNDLKNEIENKELGIDAKLKALLRVPVTFMSLDEKKKHSDKIDKERMLFEDRVKLINQLNQERARISELIRSSYFFEYTIMFINPEIEIKWGISIQMGDKIVAIKYIKDEYTVEPLGKVEYCLKDEEDVALVKKQRTNEYMPVRTWLIIKPDAPKRVTDGGLFLPDTAILHPNTGTIVSAGSECVITPGQKVRFQIAKHLPMNINGVEYLIMKEEKLLNKFDDRKVKATN